MYATNKPRQITVIGDMSRHLLNRYHKPLINIRTRISIAPYISPFGKYKSGSNISCAIILYIILFFIILFVTAKYLLWPFPFVLIIMQILGMSRKAAFDIIENLIIKIAHSVFP